MAITTFKVIQGHQFRYEWKACVCVNNTKLQIQIPTVHRLHQRQDSQSL